MFQSVKVSGVGTEIWRETTNVVNTGKHAEQLLHAMTACHHRFTVHHVPM